MSKLWTERRRNRKRGDRNLAILHAEVDAEVKAALLQMASAAGISYGEAIEALVRREMRRQDKKRDVMPQVESRAA